MKLARLGPVGEEVPVLLASDGTYRDLRPVIADVSPAALADDSLDLLRAATISFEEFVVIKADTRVGPPITGVGKIVCVGLNYAAHAREAGMAPPEEPVLFLKAPYTIIGPNDSVVIPRRSHKTDYEVELAVIIGRNARYLDSPDSALGHVAGYTISNDVSEREFQLERGGQWDKGKNCETFNPLGPWLVTADEVSAQALELTTHVNGEIRQHSTTSDMIFDVAHLVWYISQFMVLQPGDIINTGTPQGVGSGFRPPRFLSPGDTVEICITGLGNQTHAFISGEDT